MNSSDIKDALYITEQAREAWLSSLSFDKITLKFASIGLNGFLREMKENKYIERSFEHTDIYLIKMFINDAELYGDNDKTSFKLTFNRTQKIFDEAINKLKEMV
ncbi:hypothetical protein B4Q04_18310 [Zobellia sp. OII3]|uniref:hypothetical protein n=1 Tax=Zobellia sp. OII3 TaxID=2034520 RepID=UPI000B52FC3D|nr:hypothetical protein [Zobellia sp. OII3]OWW24057.1 hypothetical protein B4Q04_18310 [Zobellia sp. OII3]